MNMIYLISSGVMLLMISGLHMVINYKEKYVFTERKSLFLRIFGMFKILILSFIPIVNVFFLLSLVEKEYEITSKLIRSIETEKTY